MTNDLGKTADYAVTKGAKTLGVMSAERSQKINEVADFLDKTPAKIDMPVEHHLHAGVYSRTLKQPAGVLCLGVLVKIPTQLVVCGHCQIFEEGRVIELKGYTVLEGQAGRQIVVHTLEDTWVTMFFGTSAKTVEEAEKECVGEDGFKRLANHRKELLK